MITHSEKNIRNIRVFVFKCEHWSINIYHSMVHADRKKSEKSDADSQIEIGEAQIKHRKTWAGLCNRLSYALLIFCICVAPYMFHVMLKDKEQASKGFLVLFPTFTKERFKEMEIPQSSVVVFFTVWMWYRSGYPFDKTDHSIEYVAAQSLLCIQTYILWVMAHNSDVDRYELQNTLIALGFVVLCARRYMYSSCPEGFDPAIAPIAGRRQNKKRT